MAPTASTARSCSLEHMTRRRGPPPVATNKESTSGGGASAAMSTVRKRAKAREEHEEEKCAQQRGDDGCVLPILPRGISRAHLRSASPAPLEYDSPASTSTTTHTKEISLASVYRQCPSMLDGPRLKCVSRGVTQLQPPSLPRHVISQVTTAYLSNNAISSLAGVSQILPNLRSLSLAHNLIASIPSLYDLGHGCPSLEVLVLEGNPVCVSPYYRAHCIVAIPSLRQLDGRDVSRSERLTANANVEREDKALAILLAGACHVAVLERGFALALVHCEMMERRGRVVAFAGALVASGEHSGRSFSSSGGVDVDALASVWDLEETMDDAEVEGLKEALRRELQREVSKERYASNRRGDVDIDRCFDAGFGVIQARQQRATSAFEAGMRAPAQYVQEAMKRGKMYVAAAMRKAAAARKMKSLAGKSSTARHHSQSMDRVRVVDAEAGMPTTVDTSTKSRKSRNDMGRTSGHSILRRSRETGEARNTNEGCDLDATLAHTMMMVEDAEEDHARQTSARTSFEFYRSTANEEEEGQHCDADASTSALNTKRGSDAFDSTNEAARKGDDVRQDGKFPSSSTEPASALHGSRREFELALETHAEQHRLRRQLADVEAQSRSSVALAERELVALQTDMERAIRLQSALEQRVDKAEKERDAVVRRAAEADVLEPQATELIQRLADVEEKLAVEETKRIRLEQELTVLQSKSSVDAAASALARRSLQRRALRALSDAAKDEAADRDARRLADGYARHKALKRAMELLRLACTREQFVRLARVTADRALLLTVLRAWASFGAAAASERALLRCGEEHRARVLLRAALERMALYVVHCTNERVAARVMSARFLLRRWYRYHMRVKRPRRERLLLAMQLRRQMLAWRAIQAWVFATSAASAHREMMAASLRLRGAVLTGAGFSAWTEYVKRRRAAREEASAADAVFAGTRLRRWRRLRREAALNRLRVERARSDFAQRRARVMMGAWRTWARTQTEKHRSELRASTMRCRKLQATWLGQWVQAVNTSRATREMEMLATQEALRRALIQWKYAASERVRIRRRTKQADAHFAILLSRSLRLALISWADVAHGRRTAMQVMKRLERRLDNLRLRRAMRTWRSDLANTLILRVREMSARIDSLIEHRAEKDQLVTSQAKEFADTRAALRAAQGEVAAERALRAEMETRCTTLVADLEDGAERERALQRDAGSLRLEIERHERETEVLQGSMRESRAGALEDVTRLDLELRSALEEADTLRATVDEKKSMLVACETALEDAALHLETVATETGDQASVERLSIVAADLRRLAGTSSTASRHVTIDAMRGKAGVSDDEMRIAHSGQLRRGAEEAPVPPAVPGVHYDVSGDISTLHERIAARLDGNLTVR